MLYILRFDNGIATETLHLWFTQKVFSNSDAVRNVLREHVDVWNIQAFVASFDLIRNLSQPFLELVNEGENFNLYEPLEWIVAQKYLTIERVT